MSSMFHERSPQLNTEIKKEGIVEAVILIICTTSGFAESALGGV